MNKIKNIFKKMIKNKKLFVLSLISLILAVGVCSAFVLFHFVPEASYRVKTFVSGILNCTVRLDKIQADKYDTKTIVVEEFINDPKVTFDQSMMLINAEHPLADDFEAKTGEYRDSGVYMNCCLFDAYASLSLDISERFDTKLYIKSAYRTYEQQLEEIESSSDLAAPIGSSEHQAGLALDVYVPYHAGYAFVQSKAGQYTASDGWKHGFIIRYQYYNVEQTKIAYEPWHIRYVGFPHAEIITKKQLSLEKYIDSLEVGSFYTFGDYIITRQAPLEGTLLLPVDYIGAVISPDNCGNYIVTLKIQT